MWRVKRAEICPLPSSMVENCPLPSSIRVLIARQWICGFFTLTPCADCQPCPKRVRIIRDPLVDIKINRTFFISTQPLRAPALKIRGHSAPSDSGGPSAAPPALRAWAPPRRTAHGAVAWGHVGVPRFGGGRGGGYRGNPPPNIPRVASPFLSRDPNLSRKPKTRGKQLVLEKKDG